MAREQTAMAKNCHLAFDGDADITFTADCRVATADGELSLIHI